MLRITIPAVEREEFNEATNEFLYTTVLRADIAVGAFSGFPFKMGV